jgi:hypothetical protein
MVGRTRPYMALIIQQLIYISDRLRAIAIPVGAGSPTIYAINQPSQKPAPVYVLCWYVKRGRLRFTVGGGGFLRLLIFAKYCR